MIAEQAPETAAGSERAIRTGVGVRLLAIVTTSLAGLVVTVLALRMLGRGPYGSVAFGLALVAVAAVLAQSGLGTAVARRLASERAAGDEAAAGRTVRGAVTAASAASLAASIVVLVVTLATRDELRLAARVPVGLGLAGLLLGTNAAATAFFLARGIGRLRAMEVPNVVLALLQLGWVSALWLAGSGDVGVFVAGLGVVGLAVVAFSGAWVVRMLPGGRPLLPAGREALTVVRAAGPYAVAAIGAQAIALADVLILGLVRGPAGVGAYEPVLRLVDRALLLVPMVFVVGYMPAATALFTRRDRAAFASLYVSASRASFVLAFPAVVLFAVFPQVLPRLLFGAGFPVSSAVVRVLLAGYVVNLLFGLNNGALVATGNRRHLTAAYAAALVSMLAMALSLIPAAGALGAAIATSGSYLVLNAVLAWGLLRAAAVPPFALRQPALVATAAVALAVAFAVRAAAGPLSVVPALAVSGATWLVWVGALAVLRVVRISEIAPFVPVIGARRKA